MVNSGYIKSDAIEESSTVPAKEGGAAAANPPIPDLPKSQATGRKPQRPPKNRPILKKKPGEPIFPPGYANDVDAE